MMNDELSAYEKFQQRYEEERIPWDDTLPPPEIIDLTINLKPGRALDLGCGYGRAAIYLARQGWSVEAIDFIPQAIERAKNYAAEAGVSDQIDFHVASAADLDFLNPPFDLAIDIGCMHSFSEEMLKSYRTELVRLLESGAIYTLFAHLRREESDPGEDPRGINEEDIYSLLAPYFELQRVEYGLTQVEDKPPWPSGWFWFRRASKTSPHELG
ncbi:MAG: class I SAM-dependent methyltransferase [Chloroflexota bacterium]